MIKSAIIDTREPPHIQKLKFGNAPIMQSKLNAGDVWLSCTDGHTLIIERKAPEDLLSSIADNRLFNQVAKMRQCSQFCYVVITGSIEPVYNGVYAGNNDRQWSYASIWGALLSIQELGCMVVFCDGEDDFGPCLERLAKRSRDDVKIRPVRQAYVFGGQEATLASLPGIGTEKATRYFGLFNNNLGMAIMKLCSPQDAKDIPGWGEKSALNLKEFFNW